MAKYAYVKFVSGVFEGVSVTDTTFTTEQTGAFGSGNLTTANCYGSIIDALSFGALSDGDVVYVSHLHYIEDQGIADAGDYPDSLAISVNDSLCEDYLAGAFEGNPANPGADSYGWSGERIGISTIFGDYINGVSTIRKLTDASYGAGAMRTYATGGLIHFINCDIVLKKTTSNFNTGGGSTLILDNCTFSDNKVNYLISPYGSGGSFVEIYNTDLTLALNTSQYLVHNLGLTSADNLTLKVNRCKLPNWISWTDQTPVLKGLDISFISCTNPATPDDDAYYYFEYHKWTHDIYCSTTNYLSATYDGTNGFSSELSTNGNANVGNPLRHKLLSIPAQDLTITKDITINILTDNVTLTDTGLFLEAVHPDNTDLALGVTVSTRNSDILATGTNLTTNTEAWTESLGTPVKQEVTVTIPALTNVDNGVVDIYVNLTLASTTVWACPEYVVT